MSRNQRQLPRSARRGAGALVAIWLLVACGGPDATTPSTETPVDRPQVERTQVEGSRAQPDPADASIPPSKGPAPTPGPDGTPERVRIDAIQVDAELTELGLRSDGAMEVPDFGLAGWYTEGPAPGHPGPAVIAAHVDSTSGPDVFFRLEELRTGDLVEVVYDSGDEATFEVSEEPMRSPKDELPGDEIWPRTDEPLLTLVTCGGAFDDTTGHYEDNVIVFTMPAED